MNKKTFTMLFLLTVALAGRKGFAQEHGFMAGTSSERATKNALTQQHMQQSHNLIFIENAGQIRDQQGKVRKDIDFKLNAGNLNIFIGKGKMEYQWIMGIDSLKAKTYRMDVSLEHFNPTAIVETGSPRNFKEVYYTTEKEIIAKSYDKIIYKDIYPKVDWVLYTDKDNKLKYDFVVHEGGDLSDIRIKYNGAEELLLNPSGDVQVRTQGGTVTEKAPYSFIRMEKGEKVVASKYTLEGNILSFQVEQHRGTLVIDPEIEWATFYGGDTIGGNYDYFYNQVQKNTTDNRGNVFIGGYTNAIDNIATTGTFLNEFSANLDYFVVKFNSSGERLWGTYYYGSAISGGLTMYDMACDHSGNIYFTTYGYMAEYFENFCSKNAHQDTVVNEHANLVKLNGNGQRVWATYYGGLQPKDAGAGATVGGRSIAIDLNNNVFLVGQTTEKNDFDYNGTFNIIATKGAHKEDLTSTYLDVFIVKFDSAGVRQWGTYYGGTDAEWLGGATYSGKSAATDSEGNLYIIGHTRSANGISTKGAHQESLVLDNQYNNDQDAYLAKFSASGELLWGTYYGGWEPIDEFCSIDLDIDGNIILLGRTMSKDGITTPNSFQDTLLFPFRERYEVIIPSTLVKFDKDGQRVWGSYFMDPAFDVSRYGANWHVSPVDLKIDHHNNYWVLFSTYYEADFYKVGKQWSNYKQGQHNILIQFKDNKIVWSSYIDAGFNSLSIDKFSNLYLAGSANQTSTVTPGAHLEEYKNGYLLKANACVPNPENMIFPSGFQPADKVCPNSSVTFSVDPGFETYDWQLPSGWVGISDSNSIEVLVNDQSGTISVSGIYQCGSSGNLEIAIEVVVIDAVDFVLNGDTLSAPGYDDYTWYFNGQQIAGENDEFILLDEFGTYKLIAAGPEGCEATAEYVHEEQVGIKDQGVSSILIYPNPVAKKLNVRVSQPAKYLIYDLLGKQVKQTTHNLIDVRDLSDGVYIIQIQDKNGKVLKNQQFIKHEK